MLSFIIAAELKPFISIYPLIGKTSVVAMGGHCLACANHGSGVASFAPVVGLLYLGFASILYSYPIVRARSAFTVFLLASGLAPFFQAYLLTLEPKLCPACLMITFITSSNFVLTVQALQEGSVGGIRLPKKVFLVSLLLFLTVSFRQGLLLTGRIHVDKPAAEPTASFVGLQLNTLLSADTTITPYQLYVVTQPGCSACSEVEQTLPRLGVPYRIIQSCSIIRKEGCFQGKDDSFATPMLLMCDVHGQVVFQHNGWSNDPDTAISLKEQVQMKQKTRGDKP